MWCSISFFCWEIFGNKIWSHLSSFNFLKGMKLVSTSDAKIGRTSSFYYISFFKKRLQLQKFNFGCSDKEGKKSKHLQSTLQKGKKENHVTFTYERRNDLASKVDIFDSLRNNLKQFTVCLYTTYTSVLVVHGEER